MTPEEFDRLHGRPPQDPWAWTLAFAALLCLGGAVLFWCAETVSRLHG